MVCGETENGDGVEKKRDDRTEEEIKIEGAGKPGRDAALWSQALTFKRLIHFQKPTKRKEEPRTHWNSSRPKIEQKCSSNSRRRARSLCPGGSRASKYTGKS